MVVYAISFIPSSSMRRMQRRTKVCVRGNRQEVKMETGWLYHHALRGSVCGWKGSQTALDIDTNFGDALHYTEVFAFRRTGYSGVYTVTVSNHVLLGNNFNCFFLNLRTRRTPPWTTMTWSIMVQTKVVTRASYWRRSCIASLHVLDSNMLFRSSFVLHLPLHGLLLETGIASNYIWRNLVIIEKCTVCSVKRVVIIPKHSMWIFSIRCTERRVYCESIDRINAYSVYKQR
jgi:hypothetical protein